MDFEKLVEVLGFGCVYEKFVDGSCSATTLHRKRQEWIANHGATILVATHLRPLAVSTEIEGSAFIGSLFRVLTKLRFTAHRKPTQNIGEPPRIDLKDRDVDVGPDATVPLCNVHNLI